MAIFFLVWSCIAGAVGAFALVVSKGALHEIEAGLAFLIATVSLHAFASARGAAPARRHEADPSMDEAERTRASFRRKV